ncbi:MAG: GGDEF domain-containing protein [Clostridia bacterium]|nr:GGDEF domain-containing protein [Clostridia bacterium]
MIIVFAMVLISNAIILCGRVISNNTDTQFRLRATNLVKTVAQVVDVEKVIRVKDAVVDIYRSAENKVGSEEWGSDAFNEYVALYDGVEKSEDFISLREDLRKIQDVNDVDCIYIAYIDTEAEAFLYIVDAAYEDACPPGCIDPVYDINKPVLKDPEIGLPAYITNTDEYGWLMTAGVPIHDNDGNVVGYAITDISMEKVHRSQLDYILRLFVFLTLAMVIICIISVIIVDRILIKPLKALSDAATGYCKNDSHTFHDVFSRIKIKSKDEIATLSDSMKQMERDINDHISKLLSVNTELTISKHVASEMEELANKDALTGVRNKTAYDREVNDLERQIKNGDAKFAIAMIDLNFLKYINDTYGHESGNVAITELSSLICGTFKHSSVFRIGGDEFAIILKNEDYANAGALVEKFKALIMEKYNDESAEPWRRISAAIGLSEFEKDSDADVHEVFRRADKAMYECKQKMKSDGVKPL